MSSFTYRVPAGRSRPMCISSPSASDACENDDGVGDDTRWMAPRVCSVPLGRSSPMVVGGHCRRRELHPGATEVGAGYLMMDMVRRTRRQVKEAHAEQHGGYNAKESVIPHLVPP